MPGREGNLSCPGVLKKTGMEKITIKIGGKEYPCRQTMGALLRFKRAGRFVVAGEGLPEGQERGVRGVLR